MGDFGLGVGELLLIQKDSSGSIIWCSPIMVSPILPILRWAVECLPLGVGIFKGMVLSATECLIFLIVKEGS
jgi:hypothetical protein